MIFESFGRDFLQIVCSYVGDSFMNASDFDTLFLPIGRAFYTFRRKLLCINQLLFQCTKPLGVSKYFTSWKNSKVFSSNINTNRRTCFSNGCTFVSTRMKTKYFLLGLHLTVVFTILPSTPLDFAKRTRSIFDHFILLLTTVIFPFVCLFV